MRKRPWPQDNPDRIANAPATHNLNDYAGIYTNPGYGSFEITATHELALRPFSPSIPGG